MAGGRGALLSFPLLEGRGGLQRHKRAVANGGQGRTKREAKRQKHAVPNSTLRQHNPLDVRPFCHISPKRPAG